MTSQEQPEESQTPSPMPGGWYSEHAEYLTYHKDSNWEPIDEMDGPSLEEEYDERRGLWSGLEYVNPSEFLTQMEELEKGREDVDSWVSVERDVGVRIFSALEDEAECPRLEKRVVSRGEGVRWQSNISRKESEAEEQEVKGDAKKKTEDEKTAHLQRLHDELMAKQQQLIDNQTELITLIDAARGSMQQSEQLVLEVAQRLVAELASTSVTPHARLTYIVNQERGRSPKWKKNLVEFLAIVPLTILIHSVFAAITKRWSEPS